MLKQAYEMLNCYPDTLRAWDAKGYLMDVRFCNTQDKRYSRDEVLRLISKKKLTIKEYF